MTIALIAGKGSLPEIIARRLAQGGDKPVIYALRENSEALAPCASAVIPVAGARIAPVLGDMARRGVKKAMLAGFVPKNLIYRPEMMDEMAASFLASLSERDDHSLLGAVVSLLERSGIEVLSYRGLLKDLLAAEGHIAGRPPSEAELADAAYGTKIADRVLPLSFGQSLVISGKAVVAAEAMEGTDETILRAGRLCRGGVVVKMIKPGQDERYDLPVAGLGTLRSMAAAKLTCLAVHAGWALIVGPEEFRQAASDAGISVIGVDY
jgi:DUF1009 family protein